MTNSSRARAGSSFLNVVSFGMAAVGVTLLVVNGFGFAVPLRAVDVDGYRDFAGVETATFETTIGQLERLAESGASKVHMVTEATRLVHAGIAHVSPRDVKAKGVDHYRMRVPATENWILFTLSYLKPDTYRDYEFCSYRRALERGTGRCGQQALTLVSFLAENGLETGFVALGGHAIATAKVDESQWFLLDADYGAVIPFDIAEAEQDPDSVIPHYWSSAAQENRIHELYAPPSNRVSYGGPSARYARACPIESAAYVLKWAIPFLLLIPLPLLRSRRLSRRL